MNFRNEKNYIFIVGNGFDLNLGLESKFYDFILYKYFEGNEKLIQDLYKMYLEDNDNFIFLLNFLFFNKEIYISYKEFLNALKSKFFLFLYFYHNYHSFKIRELKSIENLKEIKDKNWSDIESTLSYILKKIGNKKDMRAKQTIFINNVNMTLRNNDIILPTMGLTNNDKTNVPIVSENYIN